MLMTSRENIFKRILISWTIGLIMGMAISYFIY